MIAIRFAALQDADLLAKIGSETFSDTFSAQNTPENMTAYLAFAFSPEIQAAELAEPGSVFLIAEMEGAPVGYARLKAGSSEPCVKAGHAIELVRIYARAAWLGQGVGAALMQACLEEAARLGGDVLWLGVWERNPRAIRFYQKWGFAQIGTHVFQMGDEPQQDWVMARKLDGKP